VGCVTVSLCHCVTVCLQECGPRFTLKLLTLQKGVFRFQRGDYEWVVSLGHWVSLSLCHCVTVCLQECGPRFTLKLLTLQKGVFDSKGETTSGCTRSVKPCSQTCSIPIAQPKCDKGYGAWTPLQSLLG